MLNNDLILHQNHGKDDEEGFNVGSKLGLCEAHFVETSMAHPSRSHFGNDFLIVLFHLNVLQLFSKTRYFNI